MRINQNLSAINSYRVRNESIKKVEKSTEKLSSGLRINRAGDDAAGLAISEKMRAQTNGLKKSIRNTQDAISLIQTAEGSLNETHSILQRMRELSVQSSNDTNTHSDRVQLQKEVDRLSQEVDRIAETTEFNSKKLLTGMFEKVGLKFQVGANEGQTVELKFNDMSSKALGLIKESSLILKGVLDLKGPKPVLKPTDKDSSLVDVKVGLVGKEYDLSLEKNLSVKSELANSEDTISGIDDVVNSSKSVVHTELSLIGNKQAVDLKKHGITKDSNLLPEVKAKLKAVDSETGEEYEVLAVDSNGDVNSDEIENMNVKSLKDIVAVSNGSKKHQIDITTSKKAEKAITTVDLAIEKVSDERSRYGAMQNRLEHTLKNLRVAEENLSSAESRIRDTDVAIEVVKNSKDKIILQSGNSMLVQANSEPQKVLQLLG